MMIQSPILLSCAPFELCAIWSKL